MRQRVFIICMERSSGLTTMPRVHPVDHSILHSAGYSQSYLSPLQESHEIASAFQSHGVDITAQQIQVIECLGMTSTLKHALNDCFGLRICIQICVTLICIAHHACNNGSDSICVWSLVVQQVGTASPSMSQELIIAYEQGREMVIKKEEW